MQWYGSPAIMADIVEGNVSPVALADGWSHGTGILTDQRKGKAMRSGTKPIAR